MPEASTKALVDDIDTATRDAYQALRTALHKMEDLKMKIIRKPEANPFEAEHDEMHQMYLDLSKRFQKMREEICDRTGSPMAQSQSPSPTPEPAPPLAEPPATKPSSPLNRRMSQPYVLVPPRSALSYYNPVPASSSGTNKSENVVVVKERRSLREKRKVVEIMESESSDSESEIENYLATKKIKTHHEEEVDNEVKAIEDDSDRRSLSPLTELSSSSLTSVRLTTPAPADDLEHLGSAFDTPHTVLKPLPAICADLVPDLTGPPVASGSHPDDKKALAKTNKSPKLKSKKKGTLDFTMDDTLLNKRLSAVGPDFEVENDRITHQQVGPISRAAMSDIFGGNPQRMISYPSLDKREAHGFTSALLFPRHDFNPFLPGKIGERGLLFRLDHKLKQWIDDKDGVGPYHLMMHHSPDDYCYFGIYRFVRVDPVTRDEWLAQSSQVKDNWVSHALRTATGEHTRARVFLRRDLGREPTRAEVATIKRDRNLKSRVTAAQIMEDFNSGREQLVVWGMKCVGYNYDFEKHLTDNLVGTNTRLKRK